MLFSDDGLASIERMVDGVSIVPLTNALKEHFGASVSVEANDDAVDERCHELTAMG